MKRFLIVLAALYLQGCAGLNPECYFQGEIYEITSQPRLFMLDDGTKVKIENRLVLFEIGAGGWISAPDDIHVTEDGELFQTKGGKLIALGDCGA